MRHSRKAKVCRGGGEVCRAVSLHLAAAPPSSGTTYKLVGGPLAGETISEPKGRGYRFGQTVRIPKVVLAHGFIHMPVQWYEYVLRCNHELHFVRKEDDDL